MKFALFFLQKAAKLTMALGVLAFCTTVVEAQNNFHVFPQFADGRFNDGTYYRMALNILPWLDTDPANCSLNLYGMKATFEGGSSVSVFPINIPAGGFAAPRTTGQQQFQGGYGTLSCDVRVYATAVYTYHAANGAKIGEATVLSSEEVFWFTRFIADHRDGARLGVAIANDTDMQHTYKISATVNGAVRTNQFVVPAGKNVGKFIDELIQFPSGTVTWLEIEALDQSYFYGVGLRFTGGVFTTIPIQN